MKRSRSTKIKIALVTLVFSVGAWACPQPASAAMVAWPDLIGFSYGEMLREAYDAFMNTLVANLKVQAANLIRGRIEALLTGSGTGQAMFIQNYETFIYTSAQRQAQVDVSNFFNSLVSSSSSATQQNILVAQKAVENEIFVGLENIKSTTDSKVHGGIDNIFSSQSGGGYSAANSVIDIDNNNVYGQFLNGYSLANKQLAKYQDINRTQAIANKGYQSKVDEKTNLIDLPGSLVADLTSFAESLPMQIVAFARSVPEVIGTMAAQVLSQTIQNGIGKVTQPIDNQLRNIHNEAGGMMGNGLGTKYPGTGTTTTTGNDPLKGMQDKIYRGIKFTN